MSSRTEQHQWATDNNLRRCAETQTKHLKLYSMLAVVAALKLILLQPYRIFNVSISRRQLFGVTISSQLTMNKHISTLLDSCAIKIYGLRLLRAHGMSEDCTQVEVVFVLLSWPSWYMQVQLGRASAPQVTSTNWTNFLIDANVSITTLRPLTPCITEQFAKAVKSFPNCNI